MFRTATVALAITLLTAAVAVPAVAASHTPVCLITTSFGKETICAELVSRNQAHATFHTAAAATLTVTLEYEPTTSNAYHIVLASKTVTGSGLLDVSTDPAAVPVPGSVQACATAVESPAGKQFHLCTSHQ